MDVLVVTIHSRFNGCFIVYCVTNSNAWFKTTIGLYRFKTFIYCAVKLISINISCIFCIRSDLCEGAIANTIIDLYFITDLPIILYIYGILTCILFGFIVRFKNHGVLSARKNIGNEFVISV